MALGAEFIFLEGRAFLIASGCPFGKRNEIYVGTVNIWSQRLI